MWVYLAPWEQLGRGPELVRRPFNHALTASIAYVSLETLAGTPSPAASPSLTVHQHERRIVPPPWSHSPQGTLRRLAGRRCIPPAGISFPPDLTVQQPRAAHHRK